jgi:hypothetical protein
MNLTIRRLQRVMSRLILRGSIVSLFVGLLSAPAPAMAEDIVLRWNGIAAQTATATSPFNQARVGAIVQLAVFRGSERRHRRLRVLSRPANGGTLRRIGGGGGHYRGT